MPTFKLVLVGDGGTGTLAKAATLHRKRNPQYFDISAKSNYNNETPFLWLARKLSGIPSFEFVAIPASAPPEVQLHAKLIEERNRELEQAQIQILPGKILEMVHFR